MGENIFYFAATYRDRFVLNFILLEFEEIQFPHTVHVYLQEENDYERTGK